MKEVFKVLIKVYIHKISMEPPTYDGKESVNKYLRRVEKYKIFVLEEKYNLILEFVNSWLKTNYTCLTDLKNYSETDMLKDPKFNRTIVRKYCEIFQEKFDINLSVGIETDSDDINDTYIIYVLIKMLGLIGYYLFKKHLNNKILYSIRKKT